jgi:hypothetical protein
MPALPMRLETASRRVLGPPGSPPQLHSPTRRRPAGHRPGPRSALSRTPARRRFPPLARAVRPGSERMGDRAGAGSNCGSVADIRTGIHGPWLIRSRSTCDPPTTNLPNRLCFPSSISPLCVLTANHSQTNAKAKLALFWRFSRHFLVSDAFPSVHSPLATTPASHRAPSLYWPLAATRRLCHRQFTGRRGAGTLTRRCQTPAA